ncbi:hypothetical protein HPP92_027331 [Vanilla planifolia]|uniref:Uncharacterized protein n=1 Tax=Vanilla planifolia TaxID=51239 RepID=A0A835U4P7_VANPL|nr:hypothetical protein HPP92_027331 [Vanilla planifolia]
MLSPLSESQNGNPIPTSASEEVRSSGVFTDQIKGNGSRLLHVSVAFRFGLEAFIYTRRQIVGRSESPCEHVTSVYHLKRYFALNRVINFQDRDGCNLAFKTNALI